MPRNPLPLLFLLMFAPAGAFAQPVVSQGGVLNAASFTRDGLPGDGIAQGGMFVLFGQGVGPAELVQSSGIPLSTELGGVSVSVKVGGVSSSAFLLFVSANQLAGVLPSETPAGTGALTVTFNGQTSAPVTIEIVENAFGIFTRNQAGFGPAILQNFVSQTEAPLNALNQAAQPGQAVILWGSGLGPIQVSDAHLPPVGNLPYQVEVIIGGNQIVQPFYAGRSAQFPGIDQVNFFLPDGVEGCYVSVAVRVNGVISNFATIAVAQSGNYCGHPLQPEEIMLAEQQGNLRVGAVTLIAGAAVEDEVESEAGDYSLTQLNQSILSYVGMETHVAPLGTCLAWPTFDDFFPVDTMEPSPLLGGDITVTTAAGSLTEAEEYPDGFFSPGPVNVTSTAGPQVGAFDISMILPSPGAIVSPQTLPVADRSQGLSIRWTGVDSTTDFVVILGRSENQPAQAGRTFVCAADAAPGAFNIPAEVMQAVPVSVADPNAENPPGFIVVGSARKPSESRQQVDGIDAGYFISLQLMGFFETMFQ